MSTVVDRLLERRTQSPEAASIHLQHAGRPDVCITYGDLLAGAGRYAAAFKAPGLGRATSLF